MSNAGASGSGVQHLVLDSSTIINFTDSNAWRSLFRLTGYAFVTTPLVIRECVVIPRRAKAIREYNASGALRIVDEPIPPQLLQLFLQTTNSRGPADASVLLNALILNYGMAVDDQKVGTLGLSKGVARVMTTESLLVECVAQGLLSVGQVNRKLRQLKGFKFPSGASCLCAACSVQCNCPM